MGWLIVTFTIGGELGAITQVAFGPASAEDLAIFLDLLGKVARSKHIEAMVGERLSVKPPGMNYERIPEDLDAYLDNLELEIVEVVGDCRELEDMVHVWEDPTLSDDEKFERTFGSVDEPTKERVLNEYRKKPH